MSVCKLYYVMHLRVLMRTKRVNRVHQAMLGVWGLAMHSIRSYMQHTAMSVCDMC